MMGWVVLAQERYAGLLEWVVDAREIEGAVQVVAWTLVETRNEAENWCSCRVSSAVDQRGVCDRCGHLRSLYTGKMWMNCLREGLLHGQKRSIDVLGPGG